MFGNVHGRTFAVLVVICAAYAVMAVELPPQWKEYLNTVVSRSAESIGKLKYIRLITACLCMSVGLL